MKDSKRFAKPNGWGFFNFGHRAWPLEESSTESPVSECAGCHIANVAKTNMTWIQFYPLLRDKEHVSGSRLQSDIGYRDFLSAWALKNWDCAYPVHTAV